MAELVSHKFIVDQLQMSNNKDTCNMNVLVIMKRRTVTHQNSMLQGIKRVNRDHKDNNVNIITVTLRKKIIFLPCNACQAHYHQ